MKLDDDEQFAWNEMMRAFRLNQDGTPAETNAQIRRRIRLARKTMTSQPPTVVMPPKPTWTWDWQHIAIVIAYAYGAVQSGYPLAAAVFAHGTPSWTALLGLCVLLGSAVWGFLKNPPNSVESAVDAGKVAVGQAPAILARRASQRPPASLPKWEPVLTGTLQDENDKKENDK